MAKKGLLLILTLSTLLSLTSCGIDYRYSLDENLHNQVKLFFEEDSDDPSHIIYKDKKYIFLENHHPFSVNMWYPDTDIHGNVYEKFYKDELIAWNGYRWIWYLDEYYSYTPEEPLFIYKKSWVFFLEDYDYSTDTFLIGDCPLEFEGEDIFFSKQPYFYFSNPTQLHIYPTQCTRVEGDLQLECIEDQWYVSLRHTNELWIPSNEFIETLLENGILQP